MTEKRPEAYPITYGVLGLLAQYGALSGYDLKRLFDQVLAPMWGAAHSQIYHELRRLRELGWAEMQREEQEARPDRKVYTITDAGLTALRSWEEQAPAAPQMRDELLLKLMFGDFGTPEALKRHLQESISVHERQLLQYRTTMQQLFLHNHKTQPSGRPNPYEMEQEEPLYLGLVARFAITFERAYLEWLYEALALVDERTGGNEEDYQGDHEEQ